MNEDIASRITTHSTVRTEAFSDAVFAIVVTLLILEVHPPTTNDVEEYGSLTTALLAAWPSYFAYVATFLTVGVIWLNHHSAFSKLAAVDGVVIWWNLILLMAVSFTPFPTALVAETLREDPFGASARTAAALYACVFLVCTVPWLLIWSRLARVPQLFRSGYTAAYARSERRRASVGIVLYLIGAGVAVAAPVAAVALFLGCAVFYATTTKGAPS